MPQTNPVNGAFTVGRTSRTQATLRAQMPFYQKLGDRHWKGRTWLLVGNVQNSGWIASMDKIIFTLNSQKNLSYTLPMDGGIGVIHFVSLFHMHLLVPVQSTLTARSKIKNQVITSQGSTLFLAIVRCILAFGSKNNHVDMDSCQQDRRTGTHPTCTLDGVCIGGTVRFLRASATTRAPVAPPNRPAASWNGGGSLGAIPWDITHRCKGDARLPLGLFHVFHRWKLCFRAQTLATKAIGFLAREL